MEQQLMAQKNNKISKKTKKSVEGFTERLGPLRDELNLNLAMAEQEEKNVRFLGTILQNLKSIKRLCDEFDQPLFSNAISIIRGIVPAIVVDEVDYKTGLQNVLKLHKTLEDAFEGFLSNNLLPESFEKDFNPEPREHTFREKGG